MRWPLFAISTFCFAVILTAASDDLPAGPGKEVVLKMCGNCHAITQATGSKYSRKSWSSVVDDMVSRGAEGTDEEVNTVISYLSRNFGKPVNINTSTAKEIENGLSFTPADSERIVQYRADKGVFKTYDDLSKVPGIDAKLLEEQTKNILF